MRVEEEEEEEEDSTVDKGKIDFYHGEGRVKRREDEVSELQRGQRVEQRDERNEESSMSVIF